MFLKHGVDSVIKVCQLKKPKLNYRFINLSPTEISFSTSLNSQKLLDFFSSKLPSIIPTLKIFKDRYFDTPKLELYRQNLSLRVRQYIDGAARFFDIISVGWPKSPSKTSAQLFQARTNPIALQSFAANTAKDIKQLLRQYRRQGLVQVYTVAKKRWIFEIIHMSFKLDHTTLGPGSQSGDLQGKPDTYWIKKDLGLRVVVDEIIQDSLPQCMLEVEYDNDFHLRPAQQLTSYALDSLHKCLLVKKNNKIFNQLKKHRPMVS